MFCALIFLSSLLFLVDEFGEGKPLERKSTVSVKSSMWKIAERFPIFALNRSVDAWHFPKIDDDARRGVEFFLELAKGENAWKLTKDKFIDDPTTTSDAPIPTDDNTDNELDTFGEGYLIKFVLALVKNWLHDVKLWQSNKHLTPPIIGFLNSTELLVDSLSLNKDEDKRPNYKNFILFFGLEMDMKIEALAKEEKCHLKALCKASDIELLELRTVKEFIETFD